MKINTILAAELRVAEQLIRNRRIDAVVDRLMFVLSQMDANNLNYTYECSMVLRTLSRAFIVSEQYPLANRFIGQAISLLRESQHEVNRDFVNLYLDISEVLMHLKDYSESHCFAETALHTLADYLTEFDLDEIAAILRRYAALARSIGSLSAAYLALTVGLIVMQDVSGLDSLMAVEASELTSLACQAASPSAIGRLGTILLRQAA